MKTPHNLRKWTLAAAMALVLGTFGAGVASADPNEGISGGADSNTGGGVNLGPVGGGAGSNAGGGVNLGPDGVSAGSNTGGGVNLGPVGGGAGSSTGGGAQFWSAPR